tara:strand:- start:180 stop:419 length:240 start_codon:yes stop_codon:yes gene_type:complete
MTISKYVTLKKLQEMYGWSKSAIDQKVHTRNWLENVHYIKKSNRRYYCVVEIDRWIEGKEPSKKATEALKKASQAAHIL